MLVRVFDINDGLDGRIQLGVDMADIPVVGDLIYTDDGDWLVRERLFVAEEGGMHVSVLARWVTA